MSTPQFVSRARRRSVTERLVEVGIDPSVGSGGASYGNPLAETVIGLFRAEVIRRRGPWRSLEAVEFSTLDWVDWRARRILGLIGNVPSAKAEERYCAQAGEPVLAA